jgi:hypothetical protein
MNVRYFSKKICLEFAIQKNMWYHEYVYSISLWKDLPLSLL